MTEFTEFIRAIREYTELEYEEKIDGDTFVITVKCRDEVILTNVVIKCECETAEEVRAYVYEKTVEALYDKGIKYINEKCRKKQT